MTREDANKKLWSYGTINTITKDECNQLMNEIYTHLESRTCENCKHYRDGLSVKTGLLLTWCQSGKTLDDVDIKKTFGCNEFERVDND